MKPPKITPRATIFLKEGMITWSSMEDVKRSLKGKPVIIEGTKVNLNDCQLSGSKLPQPKNQDDENSVPLRVRIPGFQLFNGSIRKIPGGIVGREKGCKFFDLILLDIGEDGLSSIVDDSENWTVKNVRGYGASDKTFQFNDVRGLVFENNEAHGGITGVRFQESKTKYDDIRTKSVKGNKFFDVDTAYNISGGAIVTVIGGEYNNVRLRVKTSNGAKVTQK